MKFFDTQFIKFLKELKHILNQIIVAVNKNGKKVEALEARMSKLEK